MSEEPFALVVLAASGALLWLAGWVTRRVPPNPWAGVRIPATFADDRVWRDTNERTGRDFQRFGVAYAMLALGLLTVPSPLGLAIALATLAAGLAVIVVRAFTFAGRRLRAYRDLDRRES